MSVLKTLEEGRLSEGETVKKFEQALERQFKMRQTVAVNSGTSALHLALILAGVGPGDEVILPAQTFIATGYAILYCGATPVFADIGMDGNISVEDIQKRVSRKTKAILAVSWGGNPCDLYDLEEMCRVNRWRLIQDNAHALGAEYEGLPLSDYGDYSCYSFQAIKALSTGDGGLLVCNRHDDYVRAKRLRWFNIDREHDKPDETGERVYNSREVGYKYHMNDVAASLGLGNLEGFCDRQKRVLEIAKRYDEEFSPYHGSGIILPYKKDGCSYWLYDIMVENRSEFIRGARSKGIPVSVVHLGIDHNHVFGGKKDLPTQRYWDTHHVCLPIHPSMTDEDVEQVIGAVNAGW